jgi:hypothetical protein
MVSALIMPRSGDNAHVGDAEAGAQAIDHGQERVRVGRIAGPDLRADRAACLIQHHADDHLAQVGPVILGLAVTAARRPAGAEK